MKVLEEEATLRSITLFGAVSSRALPVQFVVTALSSDLINGAATLQKSGVNLSAYSTGTPTSSQLVGPGESVTYTSHSSIPSTWDDTSVLLFSVKAFDGDNNFSAAVDLNVTPRIAANLNPSFSFSAPIPLETLDTSVWNEISYTQLRAYIDAYDIDDTSRDTMKFLITGAPGANITVEVSTNGCSTRSAITAGTTEITPTTSLCVLLNTTSSTTLSTPTNSLPALNIKTIDIDDTGTHGSAVGPAIPVLVRSP